MLTDKENVIVISTPFGTEQLVELNRYDYDLLRSCSRIQNVIYRLASEKKSQEVLYKQQQKDYEAISSEWEKLRNDNNKIKEENKRLIEEYKLLELYYKSVRNQRDELIDDNIAMKEQNEQLIADNNLYYEELVKVKNIVCEAHSTIDINFNVRFVDGC